MDLAQERKRLQALDDYGVKTARQWNAYHAEWERQHPAQARLRRVLGNLALWAFTIAFWAATLGVPVYHLMKGH